jgi:hypothetical protein
VGKPTERPNPEIPTEKIYSQLISLSGTQTGNYPA